MSASAGVAPTQEPIQADYSTGPGFLNDGAKQGCDQEMPGRGQPVVDIR